MKFSNKYITDLTSKDRNIASRAAKHIIDTKDLSAWKCLVENSENIFSFIKQNISDNFDKAINHDNYKNIFEFLKIYSFDFDECLIDKLIQFSDKNELLQKMTDLIENGSDDEKSYAAKYFTILPNENINKYLFEAYENEDEALKYNVAKALSAAKDTVSYNYYLERLSDEDDWVKLDAAQFLQYYDNKDAFEPLLNALSQSTMPEHLAGYAGMLNNISNYFNSDNENIKKLSLDCYQHIIDSLAEVWPLSNILDFNIFDCVEKLITLINSENDNSRYAILLLKTKSQLETFFNNDEYKFNETKDTLEDMESILEIIDEGGDNFFNKCQNLIKNELFNADSNRVSYAIKVIELLSLKEYINDLKEILSKACSDEIIFELVSALKSFNDFENVDKNSVLAKVSDINIKSVLEQMFI